MGLGGEVGWEGLVWKELVWVGGDIQDTGHFKLTALEITQAKSRTSTSCLEGTPKNA